MGPQSITVMAVAAFVLSLVALFLNRLWSLQDTQRSEITRRLDVIDAKLAALSEQVSGMSVRAEDDFAATARWRERRSP